MTVDEKTYFRIADGVVLIACLIAIVFVVVRVMGVEINP